MGIFYTQLRRYLHLTVTVAVAVTGAATPEYVLLTVQMYFPTSSLFNGAKVRLGEVLIVLASPCFFQLYAQLG